MQIIIRLVNCDLLYLDPFILDRKTCKNQLDKIISIDKI